MIWVPVAGGGEVVHIGDVSGTAAARTPDVQPP